MIARRANIRGPVPALGVVADIKLDTQVPANRNEFVKGAIVAHEPWTYNDQYAEQRSKPRREPVLAAFPQTIEQPQRQEWHGREKHRIRESCESGECSESE